MGRQWRVSLATLAVGAVAAWAAGAAGAAEWTQFRAVPAQTGANPAETVLTPATVSRLQERWRTAIDQDVAWAAPLTVGGVTVIGGEPTNVKALVPATGQVRWTAVLPGGPYNPLAAGGGRLYVASGGPVYALSLATGAVLWQRNGGAFGGGATFVPGALFVPDGTRLEALDPATGAVRWRRWIAPEANLATPAVASGIVVEGSISFVRAFRASDGMPLWHHAIVNGRGTGAAIAGGSAYVTAGHQLARYALATGRTIWQRTLAPGNVASATAAVAGGRVFVHVEGGEATEGLTARSAATGKVLWSASYPHGNLFSMTTSSPAVAGGVVYVGFADGHLRAFRADTGKLLFDAALDGAVLSSPAVVNGQVEVGTEGGSLYAFGLPG
jgi:outer membrane protein assembly factor BamB